MGVYGRKGYPCKKADSCKEHCAHINSGSAHSVRERSRDRKWADEYQLGPTRESSICSPAGGEHQSFCLNAHRAPYALPCTKSPLETISPQPFQVEMRLVFVCVCVRLGQSARCPFFETMNWKIIELRESYYDDV